jgi:Cu2+-exporting ATPase
MTNVLRADVGISLSHGADISREVCGVLLLEERLGDILDARAISREAMALIESNFRAIIGFNSTAGASLTTARLA